MFFGSFLAPFLAQIDQNDQKNFFLDSDAKPFPTRGHMGSHAYGVTWGHMPMFEQNYDNWYLRSQNGLSGQKKSQKILENPKIIPWQLRIIGNN